MDYSKFEKYLDILFGLIILIGIIGNSINVIVLRDKSMIRMPTFRFLLYLSVIDLLILAICATDSLLTHSIDFEIRLKSSITCKLHVFLTYYLTHLSSILLMIVSIERLYVIYNKKFFRYLLNSTQRYMFCLAMVLGIINGHYLYFFDLNSEYRFEPQKNSNDCFNYTINNKIKERDNSFEELFDTTSNKCILKDGYTLKNATIEYNVTDNINQILLCYPIYSPDYSNFLNSVWVWIDSSLYSFIPFVIMTISSIMILFELIKTSNNITQNKTNRRILEANVKRNKHILYMLLTTNFFFIFFSLPYSISNNNFLSISYQSLYVVHVLAYCNNSVNFIFYYVFSVKYRSASLKLLNSIKSKLFWQNRMSSTSNNNQINLNDNIKKSNIKGLTVEPKSHVIKAYKSDPKNVKCSIVNNQFCNEKLEFIDKTTT